MGSIQGVHLNPLGSKWSRPRIHSLCTTEFLWFQRTQHWTKKYSKSSTWSRSIKSSTNLRKSVLNVVHFCIHSLLPAHTTCAIPHSHNTWSTDSSPCLHISQDRLSTIFDGLDSPSLAKYRGIPSMQTPLFYLVDGISKVSAKPPLGIGTKTIF